MSAPDQPPEHPSDDPPRRRRRDRDDDYDDDDRRPRKSGGTNVVLIVIASVVGLGMLGGCFVVVCIAAITALGSNANSTFGNVSSTVTPTKPAKFR